MPDPFDLALSAAIQLPFEVSKESRVMKSEKSDFLNVDFCGYLLSLTVSVQVIRHAAVAIDSTVRVRLSSNLL